MQHLTFVYDWLVSQNMATAPVLLKAMLLIGGGAIAWRAIQRAENESSDIRFTWTTTRQSTDPDDALPIGQNESPTSEDSADQEPDEVS